MKRTVQFIYALESTLGTGWSILMELQVGSCRLCRRGSGRLCLLVTTQLFLKENILILA